jgi:hypothetical protein
MVDIQTVSIVIASASVVVGIVYYTLQVRHQTAIRKTDLLMRLWTFSSTNEFMDALEKVNGLQFKDYKDYVTKYGSFLSENPMQRALLRVFGFYSLLGTLVYKKLLDLESVYHIAGSAYTKMLYEKLKPITLGLRKDLNEPFLMGDFEYLVNELTRKEPQIRKTWKKKREQKLQKSKA